ncbi:MAG: threonine synthase [[Clostridium] fimetarium]|nr:threonine synthase [Alistipes timonensis]MCM1405799.1 threonine synthase [[Clostridium] fimetarium]
MILHSTNRSAPQATLPQAAACGIAPDGGLYLPDSLPRLPKAFFNNIAEMSLREVAYVVANSLFGSLAPSGELKRVVDDALDFPIPLRRVHGDRFVLELFHGPTHTFKDVGSRFMAGLLPLISADGAAGRDIIVATSGDSGGAVANGFLKAASTRVFVLFPKDRLTRDQIALFATLRNVVAVEVDGTFDDCQNLAVEALRNSLRDSSRRPLTSGNSINPARQLPSIIYYFHAYACALRENPETAGVVVSVPCGNLGNLSAGLMAKKMGLPVSRFVAVNNANDEFVEFLRTGGFKPRKALMTLAGAMDVGNPSNIARIIDLYGGCLERLRDDVEGHALSDEQIANTMSEVYRATGYILDPQGAAAFRALDYTLRPGETGIALSSAAPGVFADTVEEILGTRPSLPGSDSAPAARGQVRVLKIPATQSALQRVLNIHQHNYN